MSLPENDYQILKLTEDKDEFIETMVNLERIKKEALDFVEDYVAHMKGIKELHKREFDRRYGFSSLKYLHKELGI